MNTLLLCPSVGYWERNGRVCLDRKFHDGILEYRKRWQGNMVLVIRRSLSPVPDFGLTEVNPECFPSKLILLEGTDPISESHLFGASVVLAAADDHRTLHISRLCRRMEIKCVYIIEYTLETRLQIVVLEEKSLLRRLKSSLWHIGKEVVRRRALKVADGLQANGYPAMQAYGHLTPDSLLFYDTRVTDEMTLTPEALESRLSFLDAMRPLRLAFSGRLIEMKGADHLVELARRLVSLDVPFVLNIFGEGSLSSIIEEATREPILQGRVVLHGAVDFVEVLVPYVQQSIDLFVCCHRQSDPSCTYLETYACGVPIAGYDNRAHQGILDQTDVGWSVPLNDVEALAKLLGRLQIDREEIKRKSRAALAFAQRHSFEASFKRRVEQLHRVLGMV